MSETKQVILVRKDLKMPSGKLASQVAHASLGVFTKNAEWSINGSTLEGREDVLTVEFPNKEIVVKDWLSNSFTKVCLEVNSEQEILDFEKRATEAGLLNCLICDNSTTLFGGRKTITCLAIGPDYSEKIDKITGNLKLL